MADLANSGEGVSQSQGLRRTFRAVLLLSGIVLAVYFAVVFLAVLLEFSATGFVDDTFRSSQTTRIYAEIFSAAAVVTGFFALSAGQNPGRYLKFIDFFTVVVSAYYLLVVLQAFIAEDGITGPVAYSLWGLILAVPLVVLWILTRRHYSHGTL